MLASGITGSREPPACSFPWSVFLHAVFISRSSSLRVAAKVDTGISGRSEFLQLAVLEENVTSVIFFLSLPEYISQTSPWTLTVSVLGPIIIDQSPSVSMSALPGPRARSAASKNHLGWEEADSQWGGGERGAGQTKANPHSKDSCMRHCEAEKSCSNEELTCH